MAISHRARGEWLRGVVAADTNDDRKVAEAHAREATTAYFRKKHVDPTDVRRWDDTVEKLSTFAEQVAPGKMALVYAVLETPASSRFHSLNVRREAFSAAMKAGNFEKAADNLAALQGAGWERMGIVSTQAAADYQTLFAAVSKRKACNDIEGTVKACSILASHIEVIEQRAADHPSRKELPILRQWFSAWLGDARRSTVLENEGTTRLVQALLGPMARQNADGSMLDAQGLKDLATDLLSGGVRTATGVSKALVLSGIVCELLRVDAWPELLLLHDKVAAMPTERVPVTLRSLRYWSPNRETIAMYSDLLANNAEASREAHPATHAKLRFMRYLEGPAQFFWLQESCSRSMVAAGSVDEACENLVTHIQRSVTVDKRSLIYLKIFDVEVLFHGEDQRDRIGVFFVNLRDAYGVALQQAVKCAGDRGDDTPVSELLKKLRPYCGDGQLTELHEALVGMNQSELRVPIMEAHFDLDQRVGEHLRNFWNIQRERYARAKGGFDPDNLTEADVIRIEGDPEYQQQYNNKSSFAVYLRAHWPDFVKQMELNGRPPSFLDRILRRGAMGKAARDSEFNRRLDHQVEVFNTLEPD